MCGRFNLHTPASVLARQLDLFAPVAWGPRFNIAPQQVTAIVRRAAEPAAAPPRGRELVAARWGLVPHWARDESLGQHTINARSETASTKPAFREALSRRRALVPADGFYEWQRQGTRKQPYHMHRADGQPLWLAGLWDTWGPADHPLVTFTILTTPANALMRTLHARMPAIVRDASQIDAWLADAPAPAELLELLWSPAPDDLLTMAQVGLQVNRVSFDDPSCIEPIAADAVLPGVPRGTSTASDRGADGADPAGAAAERGRRGGRSLPGDPRQQHLF